MPNITELTQGIRIKHQLRLKGFTIKKFASEYGWSDVHICRCLKYPENSQLVRKKVAEVLGSHPWKYYREQDGWGKDGKQKLISE